MNILEEIIENKKKEILELKKNFVMPQNFKKRNFAFYKALSQESIYPKLIAEIKPKSPSKGQLFRSDDSVESLAKLYSDSGAMAISVLTDENFFGGSIENIRKVREITNLPILRKDFILDEIQIYEAAEYGADAVLLMRSVLDAKTIQKFLSILQELGMDALVEVHDEEELFDVLKNTDARIVGVNNRNLQVNRDCNVDSRDKALSCLYELNLNNFHDLFSKVPENMRKEKIFVCESGISSRNDIRKYAKNADAILIGTAIIASDDRKKTLYDLSGKPEVKICGITNLEDAILAGKDADYLGFVFAEESPRRILLEDARKIVENIREHAMKKPKFVGVFVNPLNVETRLIASLHEYNFLDVIQLHGDETPEFCREFVVETRYSASLRNKPKIWKALRIINESDLQKISEYSFCDAVLLDAYSEKSRGGTGKQISLELLKKIPKYLAEGQKFFVAGGITPENVQEIIKSCFPNGIDVNSGVEKSVGRKDEELLKNLFTIFIN
ncbi:hypothetical protein HZA38_06005 [Candidatus Peregrinibacteria bacterium]|nr:hypothetical protein [Candidatus Peregrinibacteria bacterium]